LTPHTATSTREALDNMSRDAAQGVLDVLQGRRPRWVVNPEVL
jgi:D-3-phosphoglycerate dehydrogenase